MAKEWITSKTDDDVWVFRCPIPLAVCVKSFSLRNIRWKFVKFVLSIGTFVTDDYSKKNVSVFRIKSN